VNNLLLEIQKGENKKLEFKVKFPKSETLAKTIIAFSNTAGGKLIIGVDDNRNIIGIDEDKVFEYEEKIASIISDLCYPVILPEIYIQNINSKILLVIEVFRGALLPYYLKLIKTLNNQEIPTNALSIILGKFDNSSIKCARFKGTNKEIFIDKKEFNQDLFFNLENTIKFLKNHLNLYAKVEELQLKENFEIKEEPNFVSVIFYRKKMPNIAEKMPNNSELNENEEKIINYLEKNKKIYSKDLIKVLDLKERTIRNILTSLVKKGIIKKIGKTKGSYYIKVSNYE